MVNFILYIFSFIIIWLGAGYIVNSVEKVSKKLNISTFTVSFFILGVLTSAPEVAVGIGSLIENKPEIFIGNLIGGVIIIMFLIIPILSIFSKGISVSNSVSNNILLYILLFSLLPSFFLINASLKRVDGVLIILFYVILYLILRKKNNLLTKDSVKIMAKKEYSLFDLLLMIFGVGMVFISSNFIVNQTIAYSNLFNIPELYISLIVLSLGTNLPELSIAIRSIVSGKKDIAFGNYLGSIAANILIFGIITAIGGDISISNNNFFYTFFILFIGSIMFYFFSRSGKKISVKEGYLLLLVYIVFIIFEVSKIIN